MKSYTNISQSKKLAEILSIESADMYYSKYDTIHANTLYGSCDNQYFNIREYIPCWSLTALFNILPKYIGDYGKCLYYDAGRYYCGYMDDGDFMLTIEKTNANNPIDACVEMIIKLHEMNLL